MLLLYLNLQIDHDTRPSKTNRVGVSGPRPTGSSYDVLFTHVNRNEEKRRIRFFFEVFYLFIKSHLLSQGPFHHLLHSSTLHPPGLPASPLQEALLFAGPHGGSEATSPDTRGGSGPEGRIHRPRLLKMDLLRPKTSTPQDGGRLAFQYL